MIGQQIPKPAQDRSKCVETMFWRDHPQNSYPVQKDDSVIHILLVPEHTGIPSGQQIRDYIQSLSEKFERNDKLTPGEFQCVHSVADTAQDTKKEQ